MKVLLVLAKFRSERAVSEVGSATIDGEITAIGRRRITSRVFAVKFCRLELSGHGR